MKNEIFLPEAKILVPVVGGDLATFRYGPAGGKPVLLIHGITSSNRAWQFFAQALVARGMTAYAVDLRGRGDSGNLPGPFGQRVHVADLLSVMDTLGFSKMDLIGHSSGPFVGVALQGLHPERVNRQVMIDGGIQFPLPAGVTVEQVLAVVLGPAFARLAMKFESKQSYRNYWKAQPAFAKGWSSALDEYADYDLRGESPNFHSSVNPKAVEEDTAENFVAFDLNRNTLKNLTDEIVMLRAERGLQNEENALYPMPILEAALVDFPKVKLHTVPDTNHYDIVMSPYGAESCVQYIYGEANQ